MKLTNIQSELKRNSLQAADERAAVLCLEAKRFEEAGDYEAARQILSEIWPDGPGHRPVIHELTPRVAADVLLRVGALTGWLGSARQTPGAQEQAKDLITECLTIFESLNEQSKTVEAQSEMAVCYWRAGMLDEGRITLREALRLASEADHDLKVEAILRLAVIERTDHHVHEALRLLTDNAELFAQSSNPTLKGRYHAELATTLNNIGFAESRPQYIDRALIEFAAAGVYFEQAGHLRYEGRIENNFGILLLKLERFAEAHEHLQRARQLFSSLKDIGSVAQVDETSARALLAEGKYPEAELVAQNAVTAFEQGDEQALLAEALTTRGAALARLGGQDMEARNCFRRAIETASACGDNQGGARAALTFIEELHARMKDSEFHALLAEADGLANTHPPYETLARLRACTSLQYISEVKGDAASARHHAPASRAATRRRRLADEPAFNVSPQLNQLMLLARLIAPTGSPVLITGETGTGKGELARLIHEWSAPGKEFRRALCAELPSMGLASMCGFDGTLYLEGINHLTLAQQSGLLDIIDSQRNAQETPASADSSSSTARIIASTRSDLNELVFRDKFRAALYYNLSAVVLDISPLRERPDDTAVLARRFFDDALAHFNCRTQLNDEGLSAIQSLPLYGNVAELRALIDRLVITRREGLVRAGDVERAARKHQTAPPDAADNLPCDLKAELASVERQLIEQALRASGGQITRAATLLGFKHPESLTSIIRHRHEDLMAARTKPKPRRKSIVKKKLKLVEMSKGQS